MSRPWLTGLLIAALLPLTPITLRAQCPSTLDFHIRPLNQSEPRHLCEDYAGKVLLVVNTASFCGFTPQFEGLEALYERYRARGLVVLGFPSNDFAQEPGDEAEIQSFCKLTYDVRFPMFEKIHVRGERAHPLYHRMAQDSDGYPRWNFYKYLLDRDGNVVQRFPSRTEPDDATLTQAIEDLL